MDALEKINRLITDLQDTIKFNQRIEAADINILAKFNYKLNYIDEVNRHLDYFISLINYSEPLINSVGLNERLEEIINKKDPIATKFKYMVDNIKYLEGSKLIASENLFDEQLGIINTYANSFRKVG